MFLFWSSIIESVGIGWLISSSHGPCKRAEMNTTSPYPYSETGPTRIPDEISGGPSRKEFSKDDATATLPPGRRWLRPTRAHTWTSQSSRPMHLRTPCCRPLLNCCPRIPGFARHPTRTTISHCTHKITILLTDSEF